MKVQTRKPQTMTLAAKVALLVSFQPLQRTACEVHDNGEAAAEGDAPAFSKQTFFV